MEKENHSPNSSHGSDKVSVVTQGSFVVSEVDDERKMADESPKTERRSRTSTISPQRSRSLSASTPSGRRLWTNVPPAVLQRDSGLVQLDGMEVSVQCSTLDFHLDSGSLVSFTVFSDSR